jgi:hypothetical protein
MRLRLAQCQCPVVFNAAGHLLWYGVDPDVVLELLLAWNRVRCRPLLDEAQVAQVSKHRPAAFRSVVKAIDRSLSSC